MFFIKNNNILEHIVQLILKFQYYKIYVLC